MGYTFICLYVCLFIYILRCLFIYNLYFYLSIRNGIYLLIYFYLSVNLSFILYFYSSAGTPGVEALELNGQTVNFGRTGPAAPQVSYNINLNYTEKQCLKSGSVGSARFWLPGSGSAKIGTKPTGQLSKCNLGF